MNLRFLFRLRQPLKACAGGHIFKQAFLTGGIHAEFHDFSDFNFQILTTHNNATATTRGTLPVRTELKQRRRFQG